METTTEKKWIRHCCICNAAEFKGEIVGPLEDLLAQVRSTGAEPNDYFEVTSTILSNECYKNFYKGDSKKFDYETCKVGGDSNGIGMEKLETRAPGGY